MTQSSAIWRETGRGVVLPWKCDHFGHMNVRWYGEHFDDASFHIWSTFDMPLDRIEAEHGVTAVVASTKIDFLRELKVGQLFVIEAALARVGTKSFSYRQRLRDTTTGEIHAVNEVVEVFFDPETRQPAPMPEAVRARLESRIVTED